MTGFARVRKSLGRRRRSSISLKSVNHRGLDLHFHLPPELDAIENEVRAVAEGGVARGHVQIQRLAHAHRAAAMRPLEPALLDLYMRRLSRGPKLLRVPASSPT
jgi:uncharacterized protein YicC (UPF0701 family)